MLSLDSRGQKWKKRSASYSYNTEDSGLAQGGVEEIVRSALVLCTF